MDVNILYKEQVLILTTKILVSKEWSKPMALENLPLATNQNHCHRAR